MVWWGVVSIFGLWEGGRPVLWRCIFFGRDVMVRNMKDYLW